jgi:hypothetical protein
VLKKSVKNRVLKKSVKNRGVKFRGVKFRVDESRQRFDKVT